MTQLATPRHRVWLLHAGDCGANARSVLTLGKHGIVFVREVYEGSGGWHPEGSDPNQTLLQSDYYCFPD